MLYLDKLLAQLLFPLGLMLACLAVAALLVALRRRRAAAVLAAAGLLWCLVWSLPVASDALRASLENRYPMQQAAALPRVDAVVLLGGGIHGEPLDWPYPDLGPAADRIWHAARLFKAGRADWVLVSGGSMQWNGPRRTEADAMARFLIDLGVPREALLLESASQNTHDNAVNCAAILRQRGFRRVLLVTSALHMPRAMETFRAAGIAAIPAATDFEVMPAPMQLLRWLPDSDALDGSTRAFKEYVGLLIYRWRGWAVPAR